MSNTFSWSFPQLDIAYNVDGFANVVQAVHWVYVGTNGTVYEQIVGCTPLPPPKGAFVEFNDLTPEIVTGWVTTTLGSDEVSKMQGDIDERIVAKANPASGNLPPPWATA